MPSLITVLGSCLVAAGTMYPWSAAVAADRPVNPAGEPWWSNPPTAASPVAGPKVAEYVAATVAADSRPKAGETAPPGRAGQGAEFAPDPPGSRGHDSLPAVFQQDFTSAGRNTRGGCAGRPTESA